MYCKLSSRLSALGRRLRSAFALGVGAGVGVGVSSRIKSRQSSPRQRQRSQRQANMSYYYDYYDSDPIPTGDLGFFGNSSGGGHYWPWNGTASLGDAYLFEDEDGPVDEVASPINYLQPTILVCICLAGLVGNALVIFVIVRQVSMRKVTHFYLTSLAVVNVLYLMASVPLTSVAYALGHWPFGVSICE